MIGWSGLVSSTAAVFLIETDKEKLQLVSRVIMIMSFTQVPRVKHFRRKSSLKLNIREERTISSALGKELRLLYAEILSIPVLLVSNLLF